MSGDKPTTPTKVATVKRANLILGELAITPVIYLAVALLLELAGESFSTNQDFILKVLLALVLFSIATFGATIVVMTSKRLLAIPSRYGPFGRPFQIMSIGAVLSQTQAVYGLILTFLSGSVSYLVGFSLVAWASLFWVRGRFKQSLEKLPDTAGSG